MSHQGRDKKRRFESRKDKTLWENTFQLRTSNKGQTAS